jgi:hypothetical protein
VPDPYTECVDVIASPAAVDFVTERGGRLFVWTHKGG